MATEDKTFERVEKERQILLKLEDPTMFESIASVRPDGAQLTAKRVAFGTNTPLHWKITMRDRFGQFIFNELPIFEDADGRTFKLYLTRDLSGLAQEASFTDWQHLPVALVEGFELVNGEYEKRLMPRYQLPDPSSYPLQ